MCSVLFSMVMRFAIAFLLVVHVCSVVSENEGSHNLFQTFSNGRNNAPARSSSDKDTFHASRRFSSDVTHLTVSPRVSKPQHDSVIFANFSTLPSSLQSLYFHHDSNLNSHKIDPSITMLQNDAKKINHSRITEKTFSEDESFVDYSVFQKQEPYKVPEANFENVISSSTSHDTLQDSLRGNETNNNFTLSFGFHYRDRLHSGQNSRELGKVPRFSNVGENGKRKLKLREMSALAKSEKVNRYKDHFFSGNDQQKKVTHKMITPFSSRARSLRDPRSPVRFRRDLLLKNERFGPRPGVSSRRSDGRSKIWRVFDSLIDNMGINGIYDNLKSILQSRQSEKPEKLFLMKQALDYIKANELGDPYLTSRATGFLNSPDSGQQSEFKTYIDSVNKDSPSDLNQNLQNSISSLSPTDRGVQKIYQAYLIKRQFDAIGNGVLSGMSQNHLGKRSFDYTGSAILPETYNKLSEKRNFDAIGGGILSGIKQNHMGKRNYRFMALDDGLGNERQNNPSIQQFDLFGRSAEKSNTNQIIFEKNELGSIFGDLLDNEYNNKMQQRFNDRTLYDSNLFPDKYNNIEDRLGDETLLNMNLRDYKYNIFQDTLDDETLHDNDYPDNEYKTVPERLGDESLHDNRLLAHKYNTQQRLIDDASLKTISYLKQRIRDNQNVDSISKETINRMNQNYAKKYHIAYPSNSRFDDVDHTVLIKRLDAISDGALGGIRQNFFDKKYFDFLTKEPLAAMQKNFLPKRYYNNINGGFYRGNWQAYVSKRNFGSSFPRIFWIPENKFHSEQGTPTSISLDPFDQLIYNFNDQQRLDFSSSNSIDKFNEKFKGKRSFDSISSNFISGLTQNFIASRKQNTLLQNRRYNLYQKLFNKRRFPFDEEISVENPEIIDIVSLVNLDGKENRQYQSEKSSEVMEDADYVEDFDVHDGKQQNSGSSSFDSVPRFAYVGRINQSQSSNSLDKRLMFKSFFSNEKRGAQNVLTAEIGLLNARNQGEMDKIYTNTYLPDKRSFDPIDSFSSLSGIGQNFLESASTKHRRIGRLPWMMFPKRNVPDESLEMNVEEKDYQQYISAPSSLFQDPDLSLSDNKIAHDNGGSYIVKFNPFDLDRHTQDYIVGEDHGKNHNVILHADNNDETNDNYEVKSGDVI